MKRFLQGLSATASPYVGKTYRVGRFECVVEDQIAEGGFSLVFLVKVNNGNYYALKRISVNNRKDLVIGKQEIMIMQTLSSHKNIITYIDSSVGEVSPGIYELLILMEYCRDGHVIQLMNENLNVGLKEELILRIFTDVCEAVAALHQSQPPVQHRDLKVENILRNSKGDFVLCDYGSASTQPVNLKDCKLSEVEEEIQRFTTLSYRAPEMVDLYSGKVIDTKADIWALGCLLYKLCFFNVPFGESVLAIQNGQFTIPENSKYSKELHDLIRYILEPDPDTRPDIYQVASTAFQLRRMTSPVKNIMSTAVPSQLPQASIVMATPEKSKVPRPVREPVSTSLKPRNRPRAGAGNIPAATTTPAAQKTPVAVEAQQASLTPQSTLLHQAQTYQQQIVDINSQHANNPTPSVAVHQPRTIDQRINSHPQAATQPGYLNPTRERPRDPSPAASGRLGVPSHAYTHTRSRSDPVAFARDDSSAPVFAPANRYDALNSNNFVRPNQGPARVPHVQEPTAGQAMTFPKWNPFSSEFVVNTETTDEDFANLRKPTYTAAAQQQQPASSQTANQAFSQYSSGHMARRYAQQILNVSNTPPSSSPYSSKSSSRKSSASDEDLIIARPLGGENSSALRGARENSSEASVNAACDVDEITTRFDRALHGRGAADHNSGMSAGVFDAVPFRKPAVATQRTTGRVEADQEVDPFGAVPFSQKEAAKLARRQAKRNNRSEKGRPGAGETSKSRNLPIVPTQVRK